MRSNEAYTGHMVAKEERHPGSSVPAPYCSAEQELIVIEIRAISKGIFKRFP